MTDRGYRSAISKIWCGEFKGLEGFRTHPADEKAGAVSEKPRFQVSGSSGSEREKVPPPAPSVFKEETILKGLIISAIVLGVFSSFAAVILVLSGGKFGAVAEGWSRAATLAFLFSIACSLIPGK